MDNVCMRDSLHRSNPAPNASTHELQTPQVHAKCHDRVLTVRQSMQKNRKTVRQSMQKNRNSKNNLTSKKTRKISQKQPDFQKNSEKLFVLWLCLCVCGNDLASSTRGAAQRYHTAVRVC
jgi:hypothetical protein